MGKFTCNPWTKACPFLIQTEFESPKKSILNQKKVIFWFTLTGPSIYTLCIVRQIVSVTIWWTKHFKYKDKFRLNWRNNTSILLRITCKIVTATTDDHKCTQNQTTSPSGHIQGDISRRLSTTYLETFVCPTSFRNFIEGGTWKKGYG